MPCSPSVLHQIDAADQQRKFLLTENDFRFFACGFRPAEPALLQAPGADPESAPIPEQQLQPVALRIGKKKNMPAQRIACKPVAYQSVQAFKTLAHVRRSGGKIDSRCGTNTEHDQACSSTATSCLNVPPSKPRFTSIRRRQTEARPTHCHMLCVQLLLPPAIFLCQMPANSLRFAFCIAIAA